MDGLGFRFRYSSGGLGSRQRLPDALNIATQLDRPRLRLWSVRY